MAGKTTKLTFDLFARDKASPVFDKFGREVKKSDKAVGGMASGGLKKLGAAFAGLAIAGKGISFLKDSIAEARESQKVNALTSNALKTTGASAWSSSKQIGALSTAISNKTAVDDEAVQSGANLLLTFKNVQNQAGKGSKIFDRATAAAVDLSASGFGSISGSSKMLGKALNDPVKGISALGRAGVTFTDGQKEQIKTMVKSGDTLGAQKMIMKEVESQVKGSAAAQATAGDKAAVSWANFKETIGTALLPILDKFFTLLTTRIIPALLGLGPTFQKIGAFVAPIIAHFRSFGASGDQAGSKMSQLKETISQAWANIKTIFTSAVSIVTSLWRAFGSNIVQFARAWLTNLMTLIRGVLNIVTGIFRVFAALLKGDWRGVWNGIKQILRGAVQVIVAVVRQLWNLIRFAFKNAGVIVRAIFRGIWNGLKSIVTAGAGQVIAAVRAIPGKLKALGGLFKSAGRSIIGMFVDGLKNAGGAIGGIAKSVWGAVKGLLNGAIDKINAALSFHISIPHAPDISINPPNIPHLYKGGIVSGSSAGTAVIAGDRNQDEVIAPLDKLRDMGVGGGTDPAVLAAIMAPLLEAIAGMREDMKTMQVQVTLGVDKRTATKIVQFAAGGRPL